MGKVEKQIVTVLEKTKEPLSLDEIAEQIGKPPKKVFKPLRKLFSEGKVDCDVKNRRYTLARG